MSHQRKTAAFGPRGFTLIELLVVLGIIALLIGLLLPVYLKLRLQSYAAATKAEINNISDAIGRYYQDMGERAYPGPFSNDQIEGDNSLVPQVTGLPGDTSGNAVTMSENLVLGLEGGLTVQSGVITFSLAQVGLGPISLNPNLPRQYAPYLDVGLGTNLLTNTPAGSGHPPGRFVTIGSTMAPANDTDVPEFVDSFPDALPILYLRARVGATGVISDSTASMPMRYDVRQIIAYTKTTPPIGQGELTHGLQGVGSFSGTIASNFPNNAGLYFLNKDIVPANAAWTAASQGTGQPRRVDSFILIAAGTDRLYGTQFDICNFGDVMQ